MPMAHSTPDDLLSAARAGDHDALGALLRAHRNGVYRYGLQVCRTTEDAEDAVQETLWSATRALKTFRGSAASIASWMFTIVRRECYRLIDRHHDTSLALADAEDKAASDAPTPEDEIAERRRTALLATVLGDLDPIHREVILLRDVEGLTAPEAAAQLGVSVQALKSRLHRARVDLRDRALARGVPVE